MFFRLKKYKKQKDDIKKNIKLKNKILNYYTMLWDII